MYSPYGDAILVALVPRKTVKKSRKQKRAAELTLTLRPDRVLSPHVFSPLSAPHPHNPVRSY